MKKKTIESSFKDRLPYYVLLAPFFIIFTVFMILPILVSVIIGFCNFDMVSSPEFIGFKNFARMFVNDSVFTTTVKNTLIFAIITGPAGFLLSFVLAWMLNEFSPMVRTILSFMFYAPALVGNAYFIWQVAFSRIYYGADTVA